MEFFFADPNIERTPPEETRILDLRAEPNSDGKRIRVAIECTPFQKRPNIEITLADASGQELTSASIIEPVAWKLEITLHIRRTDPPPAEQKEAKDISLQAAPCILSASLSYPELGQIDQRQVNVP